MTRTPEIQLSDGNAIPQLGLGLYKVEEARAAELVEGAVRAGLVHIDTAAFYGNETGVAAGLRAAGVARDDVFLTTKVWNDDHGYDETLRAFDASLARLEVERVDLYLIHWPAPAQDRYVDTWRALERLRDEGRATSIGVSNFQRHHLERLAAETGTVPSVNQIELHPWLPQRELRAFHAEHGIATESWSPLARGRAIDDPVLRRIGARHGRSAAQVAVRWHVQQGLIVFPKSNALERVLDNLDVLGFALDEDDLARVAALESGERTGSHPDRTG